jgi:hypothetical protein
VQCDFSFVQSAFVEPGVAARDADPYQLRVVSSPDRTRSGVVKQPARLPRASTAEERTRQRELTARGMLPIVPA